MMGDRIDDGLQAGRTVMGETCQSQGDRWTVLVVDDNQQNLELLLAYLDDEPEIQTLQARNGVEALQVIDRCRPDLVLLDIMMPKMSGFEVCQQLKSNPLTRDILVVMVTALNETADEERAKECGTDAYVTKPIDRAGLVQLVLTMLQAKARR